MHDWRAVAALYAGLFFNLVFLQTMGFNRHLASAPFELTAGLLLGGIFLARGVFWPAATSGLGFTALLTERLGRLPAMFIKWVLLPAWLLSWSSANIQMAGDTLTSWPMFFGWLLLAGLGSAQPTTGSFFAIKVSVALVLGLLLSVRQFLPGIPIDPIAWTGQPAQFLPWSIPALLLAGTFRTANPRGVAVFGILLPVLIATMAAVYTTAGASEISMYFYKFPIYLEYAAARYDRLGWVKLMLLSFTLVLATRFAAYVALRLTGLERSVINSLVVTAALAACTFALRSPYWLLASIPFAPLAGVLAAKPIAPRWALAAWLAGCAAYATGPNVFLGWLTSFLICSIHRATRPA